MKAHHTSFVGWLCMLLAAFLICLSSLLVFNARIFNASIDEVIQETFDSFMFDTTQALVILQADPLAKVCSTQTQHAIEHVQVKIQQVLRISIVRDGRIWCDSDSSALGDFKPKDWASPQSNQQTAHQFETEISQGAVLPFKLNEQAMEMVVFVTPFKNSRNTQLALWSLNWPTSLTVAGLLALTALSTLWLQRRLQCVFDSELDTLDRIASSSEAPLDETTAEQDLAYWAQHALQEMDHAQFHLDQQVEAR